MMLYRQEIAWVSNGFLFASVHNNFGRNRHGTFGFKVLFCIFNLSFLQRGSNHKFTRSRNTSWRTKHKILDQQKYIAKAIEEVLHATFAVTKQYLAVMDVQMDYGRTMIFQINNIHAIYTSILVMIVVITVYRLLQ